MKRSTPLAALAVLLLLTGCAPTAPAGGASKGDSSKGDSSASKGDGGAAGGKCAGVAEDDLKPFSSKLVTEPIKTNAVYGDGSEISFTTSLGAGLYPTFSLLKFVGATPTAYTAGNWEDAGDGRYTANFNVFDSDLNGQEGLVEVDAIPDGVTYDGERYEGKTVVLGIYCIKYAVKP